MPLAQKFEKARLGLNDQRGNDFFRDFDSKMKPKRRKTVFQAGTLHSATGGEKMGLMSFKTSGFIILEFDFLFPS